MEQQEFINILDTAGLNWNVRTEGIQTMSGIVIPDKMALIREDTNKALGVRGTGYVPYQNEELLTLLDRISQETDLKLHSGGTFGEGKKVWLQLKSKDLILPGDKIEGYISGFNSFDGSSSLAFGNTNLTVSCQNTFWKGYREVSSRIQHSASMGIRIETILKNINRLLEEEQDTFQTIERLGNVTMSEKVKQLVINKMFDLDKEEKLDTEYSSRKKNQMDKFYIDMSGELKSKGENLWGLFSSVTKYTTHSMKKTDNSEAKIFGMAGKKEREIWGMLTELV